MRIRQYPAVLSMLALAACGEEMGPGPEEAQFAAAPQAPKSFIIMLAPKSDPIQVARDHGIQPQFVYTHALTGFAGTISDAARSGLLRDARVTAVHPDQVFSADGGTQSGATWGLDRIDQRTSALDGRYTYSSTGRGVTVYIIDTGIRYTHSDFGGRASFGFDAFGGNGSDCYGHGTHVAGTVGGTVYGVAKDVSLVSVRVLNCTGGGTSSSIVAGLDWIIGHARLPAVANLSLGGGPDDPVDAAVRRAVAAGVAVAVSAGNYAREACFFSPARVLEAMTVGATDASDARASFSNYGTCVDWFAPGVSITSAGSGGDAATAVKSGTSMAAPHTAGAAALYLEQNPTASALQVSSALASAATPRVVSSPDNSRGSLLYTAWSWSGGGGNIAPTAKFSASCTGRSCAFTDESSDSDGSVSTWHWNFGDQTTGTTRNPSHNYATDGTYRVTLVVTDNAGAIGSTWKDVATTQAPPANLPPTATFFVNCTRLSCVFADGSTDPDGVISKWQWNFGDGASLVQLASGTPSHVFAAGGVYSVTLTVTDDDGAVGASKQNVAVGLILTAKGAKRKGRNVVDLTWTGAETSQVSIFVNGALGATLANTGSATYTPATRGQGTYILRVCEVSATPMCSLDQKVVF